MSAVLLRGTGIQTGSANSYVVNFPAGTVAGDLAIVMVGHGWGVNTPSGWTSASTLSGSNWNGAVLYKVLDAGDISTGFVTVTMAGSFNGVLSIATIQTGTFDTGFAPFVLATRNGGGSSSITIANYATTPDDLQLYWGSNRAASTNTVSIGSNQRQANDGSAASGCLYTENTTTPQPSAQFNYSSSGSGNYQAVIQVRAIPTVPSWIRGTGIQVSSNSSYTVPWPSGTVAGDLAIIAVGGAWVATTPSGWTSIDSNTGSNWQGFVFYKVLDSTDISTGNVSVAMSGTFDTVLAIATIKSASFAGYANPVVTSSRNSTSALSRTFNYTSSHTTDYVLYFGSYKSPTTQFSWSTESLGDIQQRITDSPPGAGAGSLYAGSPASVGTISPVFYYTQSGSGGDYQAAILLTGTGAVSQALAGKGSGGGSGKGAFSSFSLGVSGKGMGKGRGKGLLLSAMPLHGSGGGKGRGKVGPQTMLNLVSKGWGKSFGKAGSKFYLQIKGKGRGKSSGKALPVTFLFLLHATGHAAGTGRLVAKVFGDQVVAFTAYFWRRP